MSRRTTSFLLAAMVFGAYFFLGCNEEKSKEEREWDNYKRAETLLKQYETEELAKGPRIDSTFLGFSFGMSPADFDKHFEELKRDKVLVYDGSIDDYVFEITTDNGTIYKGTILLGFDKSELFEVGLQIEPSMPIVAFGQITKLYDSKYQDYKTVGKFNPILQTFSRYYLKGNLKISVEQGLTTLSIKYDEVTRQKDRELRDSISTSEKSQKTKDAL